jgi:ABC-type branched-subunit amino acid transport system ATPase component
MSLVLDGVVLGADEQPVRLAVAPGGWETLGREDADEVFTTFTRLGPVPGPLLLDGRPIDRLPARERIEAGLLAAASRVEAAPALDVLDVVLLTRGVPGRFTTWRAALGSGRARALLDDEHAAVRALAGRLGLGGWLDRGTVDLPEPIAALVDITRALAAEPHGLLWRRPDWLAPDEQQQLAGVVREEAQRIGCAVLEVTRGGRSSLAHP